MISSTRSAAHFSTIDTLGHPPVVGNCCPASEAVNEGAGRSAPFPWSPVLPPKPKPVVEPAKPLKILERIEEAIEWAVGAFKNFASKLSEMLTGLKQLPSWMRWL